MLPPRLLPFATALAAAVALAACSSSSRYAGASHGSTPATTAYVPAPGPTPAAHSTAAAPAYVAAPAPMAASGGAPFAGQDLPLETALAGGRASGKPVALFFLARWCGFCQRLQANTLPDAGVQAAMGNFYCVRYDPDSAVGRQVSGRYAAHAFPTVVIVDAAGSERTRIVGYEEPARFAGDLSRAR